MDTCGKATKALLEEWLKFIDKLSPGDFLQTYDEFSLTKGEFPSSKLVVESSRKCIFLVERYESGHRRARVKELKSERSGWLDLWVYDSKGARFPKVRPFKDKKKTKKYELEVNQEVEHFAKKLKKGQYVAARFAVEMYREANTESTLLGVIPIVEPLKVLAVFVVRETTWLQVIRLEKRHQYGWIPARVAHEFSSVGPLAAGVSPMTKFMTIVALHNRIFPGARLIATENLVLICIQDKVAEAVTILKAEPITFHKFVGNHVITATSKSGKTGWVRIADDNNVWVEDDIEANVQTPYNVTRDLFCAAKDGDYVKIKKLQEASGNNKPISLNSTDSMGRTPLMYAVAFGHYDCARYLISVPGVDKTVSDRYNRTLLHHMFRYPSEKMARMLIQAKNDVNETDDLARTPLALMVTSNSYKTVNLLLEAGADVNEPCDLGWQPLDYAESAKDLHMYQLIVKAGGVHGSTDANNFAPGHNDNWDIEEFITDEETNMFLSTSDAAAIKLACEYAKQNEDVDTLTLIIDTMRDVNGMCALQYEKSLDNLRERTNAFNQLKTLVMHKPIDLKALKATIVRYADTGAKVHRVEKFRAVYDKEVQRLHDNIRAAIDEENETKLTSLIEVANSVGLDVHEAERLKETFVERAALQKKLKEIALSKPIDFVQYVDVYNKLKKSGASSKSMAKYTKIHDALKAKYERQTRESVTTDQNKNLAKIIMNARAAGVDTDVMSRLQKRLPETKAVEAKLQELLACPIPCEDNDEDTTGAANLSFRGHGDSVHASRGFHPSRGSMHQSRGSTQRSQGRTVCKPPSLTEHINNFNTEVKAALKTYEACGASAEDVKRYEDRIASKRRELEAVQMAREAKLRIKKATLEPRLYLATKEENIPQLTSLIAPCRAVGIDVRRAEELIIQVPLRLETLAKLNSLAQEVPFPLEKFAASLRKYETLGAKPRELRQFRELYESEYAKNNRKLLLHNIYNAESADELRAAIREAERGGCSSADIAPHKQFESYIDAPADVEKYIHAELAKDVKLIDVDKLRLWRKALLFAGNYSSVSIKLASSTIGNIGPAYDARKTIKVTMRGDPSTGKAYLASIREAIKAGRDILPKDEIIMYEQKYKEQEKHVEVRTALWEAKKYTDDYTDVTDVATLENAKNAVTSAIHAAQKHGLPDKELNELLLHRRRIHNRVEGLKGKIRIYARVRPDLSVTNPRMCALRSVDDMRLVLWNPEDDDILTQTFVFDAVFAPGDQKAIFKDVADLVQSAADGFNCAIFAYGQTGSGKTHTMMGTTQDPGIIPRTGAEIFHIVQILSGIYKFSVSGSVYEVYKSKIVDLTAASTDNASTVARAGSARKRINVTWKEDSGKSVVEGLIHTPLVHLDDFKKLMARTFNARQVGATAMNAQSSRSHLIVQLEVFSTRVGTSTPEKREGKLLLIDLAGSERLNRSKVSGNQAEEAIEINKSLSALGDVIQAAALGAKNIPYRNHVLTKIMRDAIGGQSKTLMFVNVSPSPENYDETLMALRWAQRAKTIENTPR